MAYRTVLPSIPTTKSRTFEAGRLPRRSITRFFQFLYLRMRPRNLKHDVVFVTIDRPCPHTPKNHSHVRVTFKSKHIQNMVFVLHLNSMLDEV